MFCRGVDVFTLGRDKPRTPIEGVYLPQVHIIKIKKFKKTIDSLKNI